MRINENNYVDKAEEAIIELVKDAKERYGVRYLSLIHISEPTRPY